MKMFTDITKVDAVAVAKTATEWPANGEWSTAASKFSKMLTHFSPFLNEQIL